MIEILQSVIFGFQVALQPTNLIYCFFGVLIGTLVGVNLLMAGIARLMAGSMISGLTASGEA